jgi:Fe-S-cluster containining protein
MPELQYPDDARFTCVQCGACCRDLRIPLTAADYERHSAVTWLENLTHKSKKLFDKRRERQGEVCYFAHHPVHGCVFLQPDNLCLVHSAKGYDYKALACKLFPFKFIPSPDGIRVARKFHCPAVIANEGEPLNKQHKQLSKLFGDYCQSIQCEVPSAVMFYHDYAIPWPAFAQIEATLFTAIEIGDLPLYKRLLLCLRFIHACKIEALGQQGTFGIELDPQKILCELLQENMQKRRPALGERVVVTQFLGYLVAHYSRRSVWHSLYLPLRKLSLALGIGHVQLPGFTHPVALSQLHNCPPWQPTAECEALLHYYFRQKLLTRDYFGPACFKLPLVAGLNLLVLAYPLTVMLARLYALSRGHVTPLLQDVKDAMYLSDFACYASDIWSGTAGRLSAFMLSSPALLEKLVVWYGSGTSTGTPTGEKQYAGK